MKRYIIIVLISVLFLRRGSLENSSQEDAFGHIYNLLDRKEYFRFKNLFEASRDQLNEWQVLYFDVIEASISNKPALANEYAETLLGKYAGLIPDSLKKDILSSQIGNKVQLFEYKGALVASEELLNSYSNYLDDNEKVEYADDLEFWKIARDVPPQTMSITSDSKLELTDSFVGKNITVNINGKTMLSIFDTGANFSVLIKSVAEDMGVRMLPGKFKVTSITGEKIFAELGVADNVNIGNMTFNNVLFLVFPDEEFTFGPDLVIRSIIGFPIINAMKELTFSEDYIFVPKTPSKKSYNNLALDGLSPVIEIIVNSDSLCFGFDTGANRTMLYPPYYLDSKDEIEKNFKITKYKFGGAGGIIEVDAYLINDLALRTGETQNILKETYALISPLGEDSKYFYGNLGMDFIGAYKSYTINFESMFIDFN